MNKNRDLSEEKEVINFLFRYLEKEGRKGSILFRYLHNSLERYNIILRLYSQFRYKFEFDIVNSSLFITAFDLIKINQKLKRILFFLFLLKLLSFYFQTNQNKNELQALKNNHEKEFKTLKNNHENELQALKNNLENELKTLKQKHENEMKIKEEQESKQLKYNDSFDILKVSAKIYQQKIPGKKEITILAFGKDRKFNLDENGNVIIKHNAILKKIYQFRKGFNHNDDQINEYPVKIVYDFTRGEIYPRVENQILTTHLHHEFDHVARLRIPRSETGITKWELIIELFDGFVFKDTMSPIYSLKSPDIDFGSLFDDSHDEDKSLSVPEKLLITLI